MGGLIPGLCSADWPSCFLSVYLRCLLWMGGRNDDDERTALARRRRGFLMAFGFWPFE